MNNPDQNFEFIFGENNKYHQIGNVYLQNDITIRKADNTSFNEEAIRLVNDSIAYTFQEARLVGLERNKYAGQVSTIMRLFTCKDGD